MVHLPYRTSATATETVAAEAQTFDEARFVLLMSKLDGFDAFSLLILMRGILKICRATTFVGVEILQDWKLCRVRSFEGTEKLKGPPICRGGEFLGTHF